MDAPRRRGIHERVLDQVLGWAQVGKHLKQMERKIMASIADLQAKVTSLQEAIDTEQGQVREALDALTTQIDELKAIVATGGTAEERQAIADGLEEAINDLQGTIPDAAPEEEDEEEPV